MARLEPDWGAFYDRLHAFVSARIRNGTDARAKSCCAITIDARGRVTDLTPKRTGAVDCPPCASGCSTQDRNIS